MWKALILTAPLLVAAACTAQAGGGDVAAPGSETGTCVAQRANGLTGQPASQELGAEALRLTGARALRWVYPGQAVTMDFRPDRLNVKLTGEGRVESFRCG